jgi:putative Mg2+ transporter-C (MgtC) family protein
MEFIVEIIKFVFLVMTGASAVKTWLLSVFGGEMSTLLDYAVFSKLSIAAFCGALVGLEREHAAKPAGLRTNIMICVGSALFTLASVLSYHLIANAAPAVDPGRIAAQVVSGVGFIGAGVILRTGLHITGITTAATIWFVAAVGVIIGLGFPLLGLLVSLTATLTLFILGRLEFAFPRQNHDQE